jgi:F-type H+-transporting ATPase subunit a
MDMNYVLAHHLLDHKIVDLFTFQGIAFAFSKHLLTMWIVGSFLLLSLGYAVHGQSVVAKVMRHGVEVIVLYLRDEVVEPLLGHDAHMYLHYFLSLFFFILGCAYFGLVPWGEMAKAVGIPFYNDLGGTATGNIGVTAGLSLCTLGLIIFGSVRALGPVGFLKNFMPIPSDLPLVMKLVLGPLMFVIEVIGLVVKIFALTVRLFANMIAGHIVILGFLSLIFIIGAGSQTAGVFAAGPFALFMVTFVNFLEILIGLLQAFIFTLLTAVFVGSMLHAH